MSDDEYDPVTNRDHGIFAASALVESLARRSGDLEQAMNNGDGEARHPALEGLYAEIAAIHGDAVELHEVIQRLMDQQIADEIG